MYRACKRWDRVTAIDVDKRPYEGAPLGLGEVRTRVAKFVDTVEIEKQADGFEVEEDNLLLLQEAD